MKNLLIGLFFAMLSVIGFASTFVVGGDMTKNLGVSPIAIVFLRFAFAGTVMLALEFRTAENRRKVLERANWKDWVNFAVVGIIGTAMMAYFVFAACERVPSANASMADALAPLLIFIMAAIAARKAGWLQIVGTILGFIGSMLLIGIISEKGFALKAYTLGDFFAFLSALCWAIYTIWGKKPVKKFGATAFTSITMTFGALACIPFLFFMDVNWPLSGKAFWCMLYICIVPTFVAFWARNAAHKYISMTILGMTGYFTPLVTVILAYTIYSEQVTLLQLVGVLCVGFAAVAELKGKNQ